MMKNIIITIMCLSSISSLTLLSYMNTATGAAELNVSRILQLRVNITGLDLQTQKDMLTNDHYTITMYVKSDHYSEKHIKPISEILTHSNIVKIPIINNGEQHDDGSDFRIDVWVNNYDRHYQKVNYPIKFNTSYKSVDITEMLNHVLEDMREEAEAGDEQDEREEKDAEYSLIRERPHSGGDDDDKNDD